MYSFLNERKIIVFLFLSIFIYEMFFKILVYYYFSYFQINLNKNIITMISFIILMVIIFNEAIRNKKEYINYLFIYLFFLYMLAYLLYHIIFGKPYISLEVIFFQFKLILWSFFYFMLAILFYKYLEHNVLKRVTYIIFILFLFFILFHLNFENLQLTLTYFHAGFFHSAHLIVGVLFVILGLLLLFFVKEKYNRVLLMTLILIMLFIIKSRGAFYSFIIVYCIFLIKEIGLKNSMYLGLSVLLMAIFVLYMDLINIDKRMFDIHQISNDGSFNERIQQFKYGISAIKENWFWGEFAGQVIVHEIGYRSGNMGAYMHNILSFWRQYGLVFFLAFSLTYFYLLFKVFILWIKNSENNKIQFIFFIGTFFAVTLLFFQGYNQPHVWFAMTLMYICIRENINEKVI